MDGFNQYQRTRKTDDGGVAGISLLAAHGHAQVLLRDWLGCHSHVRDRDTAARLAKCAVWLHSASSGKNASNTPERLSRQNRFHTLFQLPYSRGSARPRNAVYGEIVDGLEKFPIIIPRFSL
jgi:hypothetical protein